MRMKEILHAVCTMGPCIRSVFTCGIEVATGATGRAQKSRRLLGIWRSSRSLGRMCVLAHIARTRRGPDQIKEFQMESCPALELKAPIPLGLLFACTCESTLRAFSSKATHGHTHNSSTGLKLECKSRA